MAECIKETVLKNQLRLEIWDVSRRIAGDRWLVRVEARIKVPLVRGYLDSSPKGERGYSILEKEFGQAISYIHAEEKHFVDEKDKQKVFNQFFGYLSENTIPYLSHKDFGKRFILSKLGELRRKKPQLFF